VEILNSWGEHHLSEFIEGVLIVLDVVLNTITIGIDDSSWFVAVESNWAGNVDISVLLWHVSSIDFRLLTDSNSGADKGGQYK